MRRNGAVLCLAGLVSILALSPAAASVNLLANPGFETGGGSYTGWFTFGSGPNISTTATDNIFRSGGAASKIYGEFTNCPPGQFTVGGYGQAFTPTPGMEYRFEGYSFISGADPMIGANVCSSNRVLAKVVFFNAAVGGSEMASNEIVIGSGNLFAEQWIPFSISAPVPAGAMRVEALILFLQPACDPGSVFVDDLSLCAVAPSAPANVLANPSFSTGLTSWSTFGNVFPESQAYAVRTPPGSAKLFSTFTQGFDSGLFQGAAASPGTAWQLDLYAMTTCFVGDAITGANDNFVLARLLFRDGSATELESSDAVILNNDAPPGTWRRRVLAAMAPPGTATVEAYVIFSSPTLMGGSMFVDDLALREIPATGIPARDAGFTLRQNAPNPVRAAGTRIGFDLPAEGPLTLTVVDAAGRRVAGLYSGRLPAGSHAVAWDGRLADGRLAPAGVYRYVLVTPWGRESRAMILLR